MDSYFSNFPQDTSQRETDRRTHTHGTVVYTAPGMTDKAHVLNGAGGGVVVVGGTKSVQPEVVDSWKRAAQMNMKALELVSKYTVTTCVSTV